MILSSQKNVSLLLIELAWVVLEDKIIVCQFQGPSSLLAIQLPCCHEVFEILVIGPELKQLPHPLQIVPPLCLCLHNGKHLYIMSFKVSFHFIQHLGHVGHQFPNPILQLG